MAISNWRVPLSFSFLRCLGLACSSGLEFLRNARADNRLRLAECDPAELGCRWPLLTVPDGADECSDSATTLQIERPHPFGHFAVLPGRDARQLSSGRVRPMFAVLKGIGGS